jgi:GNAT superfamily N-acetyltransferase
MRAVHSVVEIRQACTNDLDALVRALGQRLFFANRLQRQDAGRGALLTAWSGSQVIGAVYLWLEHPEEPEISEHLPGVPLLTHLEVVASHRNRDVGTMLVLATEEKAMELGHDRLALAVDLLNPDAERLYCRLGYRRWDHGQILCFDKVVSADGSVRLRGEVCHVLVKTLADRRQLLAHCYEDLLVHW